MFSSGRFLVHQQKETSDAKQRRFAAGRSPVAKKWDSMGTRRLYESMESTSKACISILPLNSLETSKNWGKGRCVSVHIECHESHDSLALVVRR